VGDGNGAADSRGWGEVEAKRSYTEVTEERRRKIWEG